LEKAKMKLIWLNKCVEEFLINPAFVTRIEDTGDGCAIYMSDRAEPITCRQSDITVAQKLGFETGGDFDD
jgi:hypothetical protein